MYHFKFNLISTIYIIQILFTAHRIVLLGQCRSRHNLVHQILEPHTVVAATAKHNINVFLKKWYDVKIERLENVGRENNRS